MDQIGSMIDMESFHDGNDPSEFKAETGSVSGIPWGIPCKGRQGLLWHSAGMVAVQVVAVPI